MAAGRNLIATLFAVFGQIDFAHSSHAEWRENPVISPPGADQRGRFLIGEHFRRHRLGRRPDRLAVVFTDLVGAIADYTRALGFDPRNPLAFTNRGNAYRSSGDLKAGMRDYEQALAIDPRYTLALINRGMGKLAQGRAAEAQRDFDQCVEIDPTLRPKIDAILKRAGVK
jgi:Tfp pilus assembly protein PilF